MDKKKFGIQQVVAAGIGTALFVVLTEIQIPLVIVPNTALQVRAALLAFLSAVYGPIVGCVVGLLGHALGDAFFYGGVWWSWVIPEGVVGLVIGLLAKYYKVREGEFGAKQIGIFNLVQVVANAVAWIVVAPVLDIVIYAEPANKVFAQGALAFLANIIITAILGTLLGVAYAKLIAKSSSLVKEDE